MTEKLNKLKLAIRQSMVPEFEIQYSEDIPWTEVVKPVSESKVTIISTGGVYVKGDTPFTDHYGLGDPSYREIPLDTPISRIDHFHEHYDHTNAYQDINCIFPIERVQRLVEEKVIGSLSEYHYSFMGYVPIPHPLNTRTAPDLAKKLRIQDVDIAILIPT
jgi:D-proline reductase (dithiol) PrdB